MVPSQCMILISFFNVIFNTSSLRVTPEMQSASNDHKVRWRMPFKADSVQPAIFHHHFCFSHPCCPTNRKERLCMSTGGRAHKTDLCAKAGHLKHTAFLSRCDTDWKRAGRLIKRTLAFRRGHHCNRGGNATSASINPEGIQNSAVKDSVMKGWA